MTVENNPANDIRQQRRGYPFDAASRRFGLVGKELAARKRYDEQALKQSKEAESNYKPYVLPPKFEQQPKPVDLAAARAAVNAALNETGDNPPLDNSVAPGIIDRELPKTATVEILDNVA